MHPSFCLAQKLGSRAAVFVALVLTATTTWGQVTAPSVYTTSILVQGEAPGTEFADWAASGITVVDADPADNVGFLDVANIQVANDEDYLYIHATLHNASPLSMQNLFLGFDTDQNTATGFDILDAGTIGSELGFQTDFPFVQFAGIFNLGLSLTGGPVGNGGALIYPFWTGVSSPPFGLEMEWAVPLEIIIQYPPILGGPSPAFPNPSLDFVVYAPDDAEGLGDISQTISYTLASPPAGQEGDFDGDDDVDGRDFLLWQRGGSPTAFSSGDLMDWQNNYGAGPLVAFTAVPEPSSLIFASFCLIGLLTRRRA